jgi:RNA methyltransferase, TrmH family
MIQEIYSLKDEKIQLAKKLNSLRGRIENGKFLIEGIEALEWAIEEGVKIDYFLLVQETKYIAEKYKNINSYIITEGLLRKVTGTNYLIPIVAIGCCNLKFQEDDIIVVLDDLKDFGNIGTIIRTCHAFGIRSIVSTKKEFDLFQKKTVDSSRGKVFSTRYKTFSSAKDTIKYLKNNNYQIITTSPHGNNIQSLISLTERPIALIVGNETDGASDDFIKKSDVLMQIPMQRQMESLNVAIATGISIYELKLKKVLGMIGEKIKSTFGREVNVVSMMFKNILDSELKKVSDLSSPHLLFLMVLKCDTIMTILDVQKQFGISDIEIPAFIKHLKSKDYIWLDDNKNVQITQNGIDTIAKLWTIVENAEEILLSDFSEMEKNEFRRLIDKVKIKYDELKTNISE